MHHLLIVIDLQRVSTTWLFITIWDLWRIIAPVGAWSKGGNRAPCTRPEYSFSCQWPSPRSQGFDSAQSNTPRADYKFTFLTIVSSQPIGIPTSKKYCLEISFLFPRAWESHAWYTYSTLPFDSSLWMLNITVFSLVKGTRCNHSKPFRRFLAITIAHIFRISFWLLEKPMRNVGACVCLLYCS